ncbi:MAG: hypothetical protein N2116_01045 [Armatimonadetes bacterium]|nr:hypothetical protein [Armatimonadota bacterium]
MTALAAIASSFPLLGGYGDGKNFVQAGDIDEHIIVHPVATDSWERLFG